MIRPIGFGPRTRGRPAAARLLSRSIVKGFWIEKKTEDEEEDKDEDEDECRLPGRLARQTGKLVFKCGGGTSH